jgi:hypothetical protein
VSPLHDGGQGFESPRLHSLKPAFCRINPGPNMGVQSLVVRLCSNAEGRTSESLIVGDSQGISESS